MAQRAQAKASLLRRASLIPGDGNDEFWREIEKEAREGGDEKDRERARALDPLAQAARRDGRRERRSGAQRDTPRPTMI